MSFQKRACLLIASACTAIASMASGQIVPVDRGAPASDGGAGAAHPAHPAGPHDSLGVSVPRVSRTEAWESVLLREHDVPSGGFPDMRPGIASPAPDAAGRGDGDRFVDQSINCAGGAWFSNGNSNVSPFIVLDDFVADDRPLVSVQFYGGVLGGSFSLSAVTNIQVEIWTTGPGGACGWTHASPVYIENFPLFELHPQFECTFAQGTAEAYEFTANMEAPLSLVPGQTYTIAIFAWLADANGQELFALAETASPNHNPATSINRFNHDQVRCGPDAAFRMLPAGSCQENDCATTTYYSNYFSSVNPYIAFDDFTAAASDELHAVQVTGGVFDTSAGRGGDFDNVAGLVVELYTAQVDLNSPCGNWLNSFVGDFGVTLEDASPRYNCTDSFGISHYTLTIDAPPGIALVAGQRYLMTVYAVPVDPDSPKLFCWGGTDALYGFTSSSYNLDTHEQDECHEVDMAFCIDPEPPCLADFNDDRIVDTRDVLAFLNAWSHGSLAADMDFNVAIDSRDVLAFLNLWNAGCAP